MFLSERNNRVEWVNWYLVRSEAYQSGLWPRGVPA
jgi:hypothetical protein